MDIVKLYVAPELELVGEASDVVMGASTNGIDIGGESLAEDMEFQTD